MAVTAERVVSTTKNGFIGTENHPYDNCHKQVMLPADGRTLLGAVIAGHWHRPTNQEGALSPKKQTDILQELNPDTGGTLVRDLLAGRYHQDAQNARAEELGGWQAPSPVDAEVENRHAQYSSLTAQRRHAGGQRASKLARAASPNARVSIARASIVRASNAMPVGARRYASPSKPPRGPVKPNDVRTLCGTPLEYRTEVHCWGT